MASTWGTNTWGSNEWQDDVISVSLTGVSASSSLGEVSAFNEAGWGSDSWGQENWNGGFTVELTGVSATFSVGELVASSQQGWGRDAWGLEPWGESNDPVVTLDGQVATTSLGDTESFNETGWGRLTWGIADWGEGRDELVTPTGVSATTSVGSVITEVAYTISIGNRPQDGMLINYGDLDAFSEEVVELTGQSSELQLGTLASVGTLVGWGRDGWGELGWGDSPNVVQDLVGFGLSADLGTITQEFAYELDSQSATTSLGDLSFAISPTQTLDGQVSNADLGTLGLEFGPAAISGVSSTTSVGTLGLEFGPADITGVSATTSIGDLTVDDSQIIDVTGQSLTSSVGSIVYEIAHVIDGAENTGGVELTANGNAQLSTTQKKFGTASLLVDGTGDFVKSTNSDVINGDFTIEFFAYASSFAQDAILWDNRVSNSGYAVGLTTGSQIQVIQDTTTIATSFAGFVNDSFNHIAISRSSGVIRVFVNGNLRGTLSVYNNNYTDQPYYIGSAHTEANFFNGYIDEFRASTVARYTSAFTPTSSAFTVDSDTTALVHFDGSNGSTDIVNSVTPEFAFQANTGSGSFDIADVVQGLNLDANTASLGVVGIQHYQDLPTGSNTSYSNVATGDNSSITAVDTGSNTSYNPVSTGNNTSISDVATGSNTSYSDVA